MRRVVVWHQRIWLPFRLSLYVHLAYTDPLREAFRAGWTSAKEDTFSDDSDVNRLRVWDGTKVLRVVDES